MSIFFSESPDIFEMEAGLIFLAKYRLAKSGFPWRNFCTSSCDAPMVPSSSSSPKCSCLLPLQLSDGAPTRSNAVLNELPPTSPGRNKRKRISKTMHTATGFPVYPLKKKSNLTQVLHTKGENRSGHIQMQVKNNPPC